MRFIGLILFIFSVTHCVAQEQSSPCGSTNKKAMQYFKDAQIAYQARNYEKAKPLLQKAIDEDPELSDAYLMTGFIAMKKHDDKTMGEMLEKAIELCESTDPEAYFQLGWLQYDLKKYKEAGKTLEKYLDATANAVKPSEENKGKASTGKPNDVEAKSRKADTMIFRAKIYANPVPYNPVAVKGISTVDPEYLPYISVNDELAFFTRKYQQFSRGGLITSKDVEKFMYAERVNGVFDKGKPMEDPFNRKATNNEGGATMTVDNKHLFFTVNRNGNFDIYSSDKGRFGWSEPVSVGANVNDTIAWDSQPSVTADGDRLYFASWRDSISGIDIYETHKDGNGKWTTARPLPSPINTNGHDKTPFIHPDGKTLYFASDSLPGLGGFDIFMSRRDAKGGWSEPVNLGYPINTESDEVGFFVGSDSRTAYFASNKINGNYDIFSFELYPQVRPEKVYVQSGDFKTDQEGMDSTINATIEVKNTVTQQITKIDVDSVTGKYAFVSNFDNDLILTVKKNGYAFESQYISAKDTTRAAPVKKNITLEKIEVGKPYTINDILFTTNSYEINDTIKTVLNEFSDYLKQNPKLRVALQGHTDNVGSDADNLVLSENRAKSVFEYLVSRNIDKTRLSYKGFGATKPIAANTTESGRYRNRRTVFVVTSQ